MDQRFQYDAALARQRDFIAEAADCRLLATGRAKTAAALRCRIASWMRRLADRLEPASAGSASGSGLVRITVEVFGW